MKPSGVSINKEGTLKAIIKTQLNIPADNAWDLVKQSQTLVYVCKGLLSFDGSHQFPKQWREGDTINTRLKLFGIIPAWKHSLRFILISDESMVISTEEKGGIVQSWNHEIKFEVNSEFSCFYTDTVEINAGIFTPFIWLFANALYRHRQRRWKYLIQKI